MCAPPEHRPGKNTSHLLNSRIAQPILFQNYLSDGNMKRFVSAARSSICFIPVIIFLLFLASKSFFFFSFSFPNKPVELLEIYSDLNLKLIRNASVCLLLTYSLITNWWWIHHQCECFVFDACFTCLLLIFGQSITAWSKYSCHCMNFFCTLPCWKGLLIGLWWKWSISNTVFTPDRPSLS